MALFELSQSSEREMEKEEEGEAGLGFSWRREDSSFLIRGVFGPGGRQLHCL